MLINNLEKRIKGGEKNLSAKNEQNQQEETPTQEWDTFSRFLES